MSTELGVAISAIVVALVSGAWNYLSTRGRSRSQNYRDTAEGDRMYAEMARTATRRSDEVQERLDRHDRRWVIVTRMFELCTHYRAACPVAQNPEYQAAMDELKHLNGLNGGSRDRGRSDD